MLKIRPEQFEVFQEQAEREFVQQLQHSLAEKYPQLLPCFPDAIQNKIVINMINRANSWGITWQSSLVIFAELMIAIAPNFDEQTEIIDALKNDTKQVNQIMKTITYHVPETVWAKAETSADDLPLFLNADYLDASLIDQTISAIPLVLWDKKSEIDAHQYAKNAYQYANQIGLNGLNDAPLTLVAWRCLYGLDYNNPKVHSWVSDIMYNKRQPREILSMIRYLLDIL